MLLMAEIGIGVHVIVSSITFYAAAILPFPGKRLLVAAVISLARMERKKVSTGIWWNSWKATLLEILVLQAGIAIPTAK